MNLFDGINETLKQAGNLHLTEKTDMVLQVNTLESQRRWLAERQVREYQAKRNATIEAFFKKKEELRVECLYASADLKSLEKLQEELPSKISIARERFRNACAEFVKYEGYTREQIGTKFDEDIAERVKQLKKG